MKRFIPVVCFLSLAAFYPVFSVWELKAEDTDAGQQAEKDKQGKEKQVAVLVGEVPEIAGPKRIVAVGKFDAIGSFKAQYGDYDIGGGLAAMLTTALVESDRFIVLERANLNQVIVEQQYKAQGFAAGNSGPELGKLIGAQLFIYGSVTEFGASDSGGGFNIGFGGFGGSKNPSNISAGPQWTKGKVAMDIRVVDASTSEVVESFKVSEKVGSKSFSVSGGSGPITIGNQQFMQTPLGEAARKAISAAVRRFAKTAQNVPWAGKVADYDSGNVVINAGQKAGIALGDSFTLYRITKKLQDPDTGKTIGVRKLELGRVKISKVESEMAEGPFLAAAAETPKTGDLVVLSGGK